MQAGSQEKAHGGSSSRAGECLTRESLAISYIQSPLGVVLANNNVPQSTQDAMSTTGISAAASSTVTSCRVWARLVCRLVGQSTTRNCLRMVGWKRKIPNGALISEGNGSHITLMWVL